MNEKLVIIIIILNFNLIFSQQVFKDYGERETIEILDTELLKLVSKNFEFPYENIYLNKSFSKKHTDNITFFSIRYITEKFEQENYYTTVFLFVNKNGKILGSLENKDLIYSDDEAGQPYPTKILKNDIPINENIKGIGILTEFSSPSRINLYSEELFSIIVFNNNSVNVVLENYPIRKTNGDSNGRGDFKIEIIESLIFIEKEKSNNFFDLKIIQKFNFEENIEKDSSKNIDAINHKKEEKKIEIIKFNNGKYNFKKIQYKFLEEY
jgi:hypothetical protein